MDIHTNYSLGVKIKIARSKVIFFIPHYFGILYDPIEKDYLGLVWNPFGKEYKIIYKNKKRTKSL